MGAECMASEMCPTGTTPRDAGFPKSVSVLLRPVPQGRTLAGKALVSRKVVGHFHPRDTLGLEGMGRRYKRVGLVEGADVELDDRTKVTTVTFPCQWRSTVTAETATHTWR